jgi:hypothetical protein
VEHFARLRRRFHREELNATTSMQHMQRITRQTEPPNRPAKPWYTAERERPWANDPQPQFPSMESITSHVIEQIDRKLVAHRERMGRI